MKCAEDPMLKGSGAPVRVMVEETWCADYIENFAANVPGANGPRA